MNDQSRMQQGVLVKPDLHSILVVDDDHDLCQTIRFMLEEEGFLVRTAADGREAVEQALAFQPALIILDMALPLLNGEAVATHIRAHYGTTVPIVLITADGHAEIKSRQVGAIAFLRKPFDFDELIQVVQQALKA